MKNYLKLLLFLKGHYRQFSFAVFLVFLSSVFEGVQITMMLPVIDRIFTNSTIKAPNELPPFLANIVDQLNRMDPHQLFLMLPVVFLILFSLKQIVSFFADFMMNDVAQRVMRDVRYRLFERIQTLSLDYFSKKRTGELVSRITNDVGVIENAVSYAVTDLLRQPILIIIFISMAFTFNIKGTSLLFLMVPFIAIPMAIITRKLRKISKGQQEKMADINSLLLETISGVRILKAFGTERYEIKRFFQQNFDYYKLRMKGLRNLMLMGPITEMVGAVCGMAGFIVLGKGVLDGKLSFGVFIFSITAILQIIRPIKRTANVLAIIQQALVASKRIYEVLETKPSIVEKSQTEEFTPLSSKIELKEVIFRYDPSGENILTNINLTINKGDLVAIVGPTGSGKSTLVNLIPRFYDVASGEVLFDGKNVKEASFKSLRQQVGIVTQESILFNDTVANNIAYGTFDATPQEIRHAAMMAHAHGFVEKMPKGYDTVVGDRGFRLSGGEKQRLTIARAILKNPPILILDEATSALDSESEKHVQEALDELMKERTVIAIAHRLSTIMKADKILVLEQGKMVGLGKHDDLLFSCPLYRRLYETQFQITS